MRRDRLAVRRRLGTSALAAAVLVLGSLLIATGVPAAVNDVTLNSGCVGDPSIGGNSCTANDVTFIAVGLGTV